MQLLGIFRRLPIALVACLLITVFFAAHQTETAHAATVSCDGQTAWTVSSEAELNEAVRCYNGATSPGAYTITLDQDIVAVGSIAAKDSTVVVEPITQAGAGFTLTVDGAGHSVTATIGIVDFDVVGFDRGIFAIEDAGEATVTIDNVTIEGTEDGIVVDNSDVRVLNTRLIGNIGDGVALRSGSLRVENSVVDDNIYGIAAYGGRLVVVNTIVQYNSLHGVYIDATDDTNVDVVGSTITGNQGSGIWVLRANFVSVSNSTMLSNGFGGINLPSFYSESGFAHITNSTVLGRSLGPAITFRSQSLLSIESSIVDECAGGGLVNFGYNFGGCFETAAIETGLLADYGCKVPTPDGCPLTLSLLDDSPAINAGNCVNPAYYNPLTDEYSRDLLLVDQRGETRKEACDSGAFETPIPPMCGGRTPTHFAVAGVALVGTEGDDVIFGSQGADIIDGAGGNDRICGRGGADVLRGGDGDDKMWGAGGDDQMYGGLGDDIMHGNRGADVMYGDAGADRMFGYADADEMHGGDGDDKLHGNFGDDTIFGGAGNDGVFGYGDNDMLDGGGDDDVIGGNFGDDTIVGGSGNDRLFGSDGADVVSGGPGNDQVAGNSGNDAIEGGAGDDALDGGINVDTCNGNSGTDTAVRCESTVGVP